MSTVSGCRLDPQGFKSPNMQVQRAPGGRGADCEAPGEAAAGGAKGPEGGGQLGVPVRHAQRGALPQRRLHPRGLVQGRHPDRGLQVRCAQNELRLLRGWPPRRCTGHRAALVRHARHCACGTAGRGRRAWWSRPRRPCCAPATGRHSLRASPGTATPSRSSVRPRGHLQLVLFQTFSSSVADMEVSPASTPPGSACADDTDCASRTFSYHTCSSGALVLLRRTDNLDRTVRRLPSTWSWSVSVQGSAAQGDDHGAAAPDGAVRGWARSWVTWATFWSRGS